MVKQEVYRVRVTLFNIFQSDKELIFNYTLCIDKFFDTLIKVCEFDLLSMSEYPQDYEILSIEFLY